MNIFPAGREQIRRIHRGFEENSFSRALRSWAVRATLPEVEAFRAMSRKKVSKGKSGTSSPSTAKDNNNRSVKSGLVTGVQANGVVHPSRASVNSSEFYDVAFKVRNSEICIKAHSKGLTITICLGLFLFVFMIERTLKSFIWNPKTGFS